MDKILEDLKQTFIDTQKVDYYEEVRPGEFMIYTIDNEVYNLKVYKDGFDLVRVK